jgi:hypothetical protein
MLDRVQFATVVYLMHRQYSIKRQLENQIGKIQYRVGSSVCQKV